MVKFKSYLIILYCILSCTHTSVSKLNMPTEVFNIILTGAPVYLKDEKLCPPDTINGNKNETLRELFIRNLSFSFNSPNSLELKSNCFHSIKSNQVWNCEIETIEKNKKELIGSTYISFELNSEKGEIIKNTLKCL